MRVCDVFVVMVLLIILMGATVGIVHDVLDSKRTKKQEKRMWKDGRSSN